MLIDGQEITILAGIAPWVIPVVASALSLGGAHLQQRQANKNQRKQIEFQTRRRQQEHEAAMRANMVRYQNMMQQQGYDAKQQSAIAAALQEGFGPKRQEGIDKAAQEGEQELIGALAKEAAKGRLYGTGTKTKGRVSGKLQKHKARAKGKIKKKHGRKAGYRGTIGAYQRQPVADQRVGIGLNQAVAMNQQRARSAAALGENRAKIAGHVGPEEVMFLNPGSDWGALATAAGAGLFAYAPYANTGKGIIPGMYGAPGTYGGPGGTQLPQGPNPGPWKTPWGGA